MKWVVLYTFVTMAPAALAAPDAALGQKVFVACAACHDPGHENKQGPGLGGIVNRKAGTAPGFRYSSAMRRSRITWTPENLDAYLKNPQGTVPGNTMPFPGVPDAEQRANLIAYLSTLH